MADLILPGIQLGAKAWRNVEKSLRRTNDPHLVSCANAIKWQMDRLDETFGEASGQVIFSVKATLRGGINGDPAGSP